MTDWTSTAIQTYSTSTVDAIRLVPVVRRPEPDVFDALAVAMRDLADALREMKDAHAPLA